VFYDPPRLVSLDLAPVLEIRGCGEVTVEDLLAFGFSRSRPRLGNPRLWRSDCGRFAGEL
jgi:hypothetical protein